MLIWYTVYGASVLILTEYSPFICYADVETQNGDKIYETILRSSHVDGKSRGIVSYSKFIGQTWFINGVLYLIWFHVTVFGSWACEKTETLDQLSWCRSRIRWKKMDCKINQEPLYISFWSWVEQFRWRQSVEGRTWIKLQADRYSFQTFHF